MAISNSPYLKNYRGNLQKTYVVKQAHKTIITAYPDMSRVKYNAKQKSEQSKFAEAGEKKAAYSRFLPKGKRLYNAAVQEYLNPQPVPFSKIKPPVKKRGVIVDTIVIKEYEHTYVVTSKPDMRGVKYNEKQKSEQSRFARAVAYARALVLDPVKKAALQKTLPKGKKAYHAAIKQYLRR
ncbi:MAG TPA: hypothetical protein VGD22_01390 [Sphingobacteriaceae bacterium]